MAKKTEMVSRTERDVLEVNEEVLNNLGVTACDLYVRILDKFTSVTHCRIVLES